MKAQIVRGAAWIAVTRLFINLIGFASTLILARLLLPQDFGLVAIATTVIAIVSSVTELSLSSALIQHEDPQDRHFDTAFTMNAARALLVGIVTAAFAWPMARLYGDPRLTALILTLAALSVMTGLANPRLVMFSRALVFRQEFILGVGPKLVGAIAAAMVAWVWQSYWALVVGAGVAQTFSVALSYALIAYRPRLSTSGLRELMSFSIWLSFSQIVSTLNFRFDTLLIGYFLGKTPLGLYSYGDDLANMVTREATLPIANPLFAAFSRMSQDVERLRRAYFTTQSYVFAIALPIGCGFALIADSFVHLALGDKWLGAVLVIQVIATTSAIGTLALTHQPLALAMGRTRLLFRRDLLIFAVRVPIVAAGLFFGGLPGVMVARVFSGGTALFLNMALTRSLIGVRIREQFLANIRSMTATTIMAAAVISWKYFSYLPISNPIYRGIVDLLAQITIGGLSYVISMYCCWILSGKPEGVERDAQSLLGRFFNGAGPIGSSS